MRQLLTQVRWAVATIDLAVILGGFLLLAGGGMLGYVIARLLVFGR